MKFTKPDFTQNIINISATIAEYLGCPNDKPMLRDLAQELAKDYKNVVLLVLDGMGMYPMQKNLSKTDFLYKNVKRVLTSVFPSTTTNATTTLLTNKYPMEHGWFGWSLYFEELGRSVDIFRDVDSYTGEFIEKDYAYKVLPVQPFYKSADKKFTINSVVPSFLHGDGENRYEWNDFEELIAHVKTVCQKQGKQFVYAYFTEPDSTMHRYGVTSAETFNLLKSLNAGVEKLYSQLNDTLLIVTADHGQVDVNGCIEIYKDEEITRLLEWRPYLEARAAAFKVKEGQHKNFVELFNKKYGGDFTLFSSAELIKNNYFGLGDCNAHAKLLGDYIAVGKTDKIMRLTPLGHDFKGHHTSLTGEMEVPLIYLSTGRR